MYGSGVVIGITKITIRAAQEIIHRDLPVERTVFCVVVVGATTTSTAELLIVTTTIQIAAAAVSDFVS